MNERSLDFAAEASTATSVHRYVGPLPLSS